MIPERPEEPGKKLALALTVLMHLLLAGFLFLGVQWKRSKPEVYEVEVWSPVAQPPRVVPPPPPPEPVVKQPEPKPEPKPEPPPKKPDIVVKEEKKAPERPKPPPPPPPPPERKPEPPKPEARPKPDFSKMLAQDEAQLKSSEKALANARQMANAAAAEAEQLAAANKRGIDSYANKIRGKIRGNIVLPPAIQGNPEALFEIGQLPTGEVIDVRMKRSSGNPALDAAIERAIRKSSPLPKPDDPSVFQRKLEIRYKPFEE